ncbi:GGDEF domain-containing protein [Terasakiella brassicae]|uniref:diguanylate cyclase n=2 Tax=Terasakiella brassicae TaxID=1634917 RepID=A0A917C1C2_9PROT|nr:GGDEF domain-containing protein [Terasakiella brassicae]
MQVAQVNMSKNKLDNFEVFPWNKNFETGVEVIDEQHKKLVDLLNELANSLVREDMSQVNDAFAQLADYAHYHFEQEEAIWSNYLGDDSWFISHQLSHSSFLPRVLELKGIEGDSPSQDVVEAVVKFLIRWLAFHIIDDDKRLALVVTSMDAGSTLEEAKVLADRKMNGSFRVLIETVLKMYDGLSTRTLDLMRERRARIIAEQELREVNRRLEELSVTDQLTGLYNRRHFERVLDREMKRARRENKAVTLYMLDIDYFKSLNDHYGHSGGDVALKTVGQKLFEICRRPSDYAFRIGGEEFAVISREHEEDDDLIFAELIRRAVEDLAIPNVKSEVNDCLTVSVGGFAKIPTKQDTVDTYMKEADARLYRAKDAGRNIVVTN